MNFKQKGNLKQDAISKPSVPKMSFKPLKLSSIILIALITIGFMLAGCNQNLTADENKKTPIDTPSEDDQLIGGQRDEHGCLGPAGYSWSEEIGACIRQWEIDSDELTLAAKTAVAQGSDEESLTVVSVEPLRCVGCYQVTFAKNYETDEPNFTVDVIIDTKTANPSKSGEFEIIYADGKISYAGTIEKPTPCDTLKVEEVLLESYPEQVIIDILIEKSDMMCAQVISYEDVLGEIELANPPASVTIRLQGEDIYTKTF
jgi:hypothetical protein